MVTSWALCLESASKQVSLIGCLDDCMNQLKDLCLFSKLKKTKFLERGWKDIDKIKDGVIDTIKTNQNTFFSDN